MGVELGRCHIDWGSVLQVLVALLKYLLIIYQQKERRKAHKKRRNCEEWKIYLIINRLKCIKFTSSSQDNYLIKVIQVKFERFQSKIFKKNASKLLMPFPHMLSQERSLASDIRG